MEISSTRKHLAGKSLDEVADFMAGVTAGSGNDQAAKAEFLRRQTEFQRQATEAAIQTASETQRYTRYMFWSVVILAASSLLSFGVSLAAYLNATSPKLPVQEVKIVDPVVIAPPATSNIAVERDAAKARRPSP